MNVVETSVFLLENFEGSSKSEYSHMNGIF